MHFYPKKCSRNTIRVFSNWASTHSHINWWYTFSFLFFFYLYVIMRVSCVVFAVDICRWIMTLVVISSPYASTRFCIFLRESDCQRKPKKTLEKRQLTDSDKSKYKRNWTSYVVIEEDWDWPKPKIKEAKERKTTAFGDIHLSRD